MRGNRGLRGMAYESGRSIPAYAGEPQTATGCRWSLWVYPRVCGGTWPTCSKRKPAGGLSPRMRGNRPRGWRGRRDCRSIPAYAGEPQAVYQRRMMLEVYPRVCGGTIPPGHSPCPRAGLSPRMRGNPVGGSNIAPDGRSIPAYAGEPHPDKARGAACQVYPRVCGGTQRRMMLD